MSDRIVVVEDDRELRELLVDVLTEAGYDPVPHANGNAALRALAGGETADLVISDLRMPEMHGDELLLELRKLRPELNVIIITAFGSIHSAIDLIKAGAYDYVTKPFATEDILEAVQRGLAESKYQRELAKRSRTAQAELLGDFVGASRCIGELVQLIARAGKSRHPVLITGESGTGKEIVARAVHRASGRRAFVAVNCGSLPDNLLESELFGHEKGAFTGADRAKRGLLEEAEGGTAFLDEVSELPRLLQPKLLRALEQGEVRRVGSVETRVLDFRVVAATNRDLDEEVREGRFREDLFWRLNVIHIHVPALRERSSDIPLIAEFFLDVARREQQVAPRRFTPEAMAILTAYPWPGNVRELRNAVQRAAVLATTDEIIPGDLPARIRETGMAVGMVADASRRRISLRDLERSYILEVLRQSDGNKSRAAEMLGLDRKTLYRKLEEYRSEGLSEQS